MLRKLAFAGTASLVLAGLAWAANAPTYKDPVGQTRDATGVVLIGTDGNPYDATGGGGGGGGAVTEADGANVTLGAKADAKSTATDTTAITLMSVAKQISASVQAVATSVAGAQPAGTAIIGKVGIDQTTPGTTNGVQVNAALPAGAALIGKVGIDQTTPGTTNGVQVNAALPVGANVIGGVTQADGASVTLGAKADAKSTATDTTAITLMSVAKQISASVQAAASSLSGSLTVGTHAVTQSGTWTVQPGNTANTTAWKVDGSAVTQPASLVAATTGGCTPYHLLSAANTNPTLVSTGAHSLCYVSVINTTGTIAYLKLYNQVAAPSTCATDAANVVQNFPIPASTAGAGFNISMAPFGAAFGTGLAFCLTGAQADNDTTSTVTGININLGYK